MATVSRALNNNETVDPQLAARVRAAAQKLGYRPNYLARNLRRQRTSLWLLIISDIENAFFTSVARGVEDAAVASQFSVVLCNADEDEDKEAALRLARHRRTGRRRHRLAAQHRDRHHPAPGRQDPRRRHRPRARRAGRLRHHRLPRRCPSSHRALAGAGLGPSRLHHRTALGADGQPAPPRLRGRPAGGVDPDVARRPPAVHDRRRPSRGRPSARPEPTARRPVRRQRRPRPRRAPGAASPQPPSRPTTSAWSASTTPRGPRSSTPRSRWSPSPPTAWAPRPPPSSSNGSAAPPTRPAASSSAPT